jgi:hypothetical protein
MKVNLNTTSFQKLASPPIFKFFKKNIIDILLYFLYQEKQPHEQYEPWLNNLINYTPVKNSGRYFHTNWTIHKLLNYICLALNVRVSILKKNDQIGIYFSSYYTHLTNNSSQYVFVHQKGRQGGLYLLREKLFFPIIRSTVETQPLAQVEQLLKERFNLAEISLLPNIQVDPLPHIDSHVILLAADSMFTQDIQHLHCIGNLKIKK